jgi:hypothetical protein
VFRSVRSWVVVAAIACGVLAGPIAIAQASNSSIIATFRAANARFNRDEATLKKRLTALANHKTGAKPVIAALRHEVRDIRPVKRRIKGERASTAKGRRGKAAVTQGLTMIANAYSQLANALQRARAGHTVTRAQLNAISARARNGHNRLVSGLRLLGARVIG